MTTTTDQTTQALLDAIRARRSFALNQLSPEPIDLAAIPLMLEAARWAPNHGLTEPWRFTVFAGDRRQALSVGVNFYLTTPYTDRELLHQVATAVTGRVERRVAAG